MCYSDFKIRGSVSGTLLPSTGQAKTEAPAEAGPTKARGQVWLIRVAPVVFLDVFFLCWRLKLLLETLEPFWFQKNILMI